jgi:hypothetical protein
VWGQLRRTGRRVSYKRVARLMASDGLLANSTNRGWTVIHLFAPKRPGGVERRARQSADSVQSNGLGTRFGALQRSGSRSPHCFPEESGGRLAENLQGISCSAVFFCTAVFLHSRPIGKFGGCQLAVSGGGTMVADQLWAARLFGCSLRQYPRPFGRPLLVASNGGVSCRSREGQLL